MIDEDGLLCCSVFEAANNDRVEAHWQEMLLGGLV